MLDYVALSELRHSARAIHSSEEGSRKEGRSVPSRRNDAMSQEKNTEGMGNGGRKHDGCLESSEIRRQMDSDLTNVLFVSRAGPVIIPATRLQKQELPSKMYPPCLSLLPKTSLPVPVQEDASPQLSLLSAQKSHIPSTRPLNTVMQHLQTQVQPQARVWI